MTNTAEKISLPVDYATARRRKMVPFIRDAYVALQDGNCYLCDHDLEGKPSAEIEAADVTESLFPPGFFNHPVHLHHSHKTGLTIGAVHAKCNAVEWEYFGE